MCDILSGAERGARRDVGVLNAAAALVAGGKARDLNDGLGLADNSIDSGKALRALDGLIAKSQGFQTQ